MLDAYARRVAAFVTFEDHVKMGGFGSAVVEALEEMGIAVPVVRIGWPDQFIEHGKDRRRSAQSMASPSMRHTRRCCRCCTRASAAPWSPASTEVPMQFQNAAMHCRSLPDLRALHRNRLRDSVRDRIRSPSILHVAVCDNPQKIKFFYATFRIVLAWMLRLLSAGILAWSQNVRRSRPSRPALPWFSPAAPSSTSPTGAAPRAISRTPSSSSRTDKITDVGSRARRSHSQGRARHRLHRQVPHPRPRRRLCRDE